MSGANKYFYTTVAAGLIISFSIYLYGRNLWLDESLLAVNLIDKSFLDLTKPLEHNQVAPLFFLWIEKAIGNCFNYSEYSLRFFPFLCYILSFLIFYLTIKQKVRKPAALIYAVALFCFNYWLLNYANNIKQYSSDVLCMLSGIYFVISNNQIKKSHIVYISIGGVIAVFFSNIAPVVLLTIGLTIILTSEESFLVQLKLLILPFSVWLSAFGLYYIFFIHNHPTVAVQQEYWINSHAFLPNSVNFRKFLYFSVRSGKISLFSLFGFGHGSIVPAFFLGVGIVSLIKNGQKKILLLYFLPIVIHLTLSGLKLYPFDLRLILYFIPMTLLVSSVGFNDFFSRTEHMYSGLDKTVIYCLIPALCLSFLLIKGIPLRDEEIKKNLTFLEENIQPKDKIYASWTTASTIQYYRKTGFFTSPNTVINEDWWTVDKNGNHTIDRLQNIKGRTWLVFSGAITGYNGHRKYLLDSLHQLNILPIYHKSQFGSDLYLYNLK